MHLPYEILVDIFKYLRLIDVVHSMQVCRSWNSAAKSNDLWEGLIREEFDKDDVMDKGKTTSWFELFMRMKKIEKNMVQGIYKKRTLYGHHHAVLCLTITDRNIITGGNDTTVRVWNLTNYECKMLKNHSDSITCIDSDPKQHIFVTGSNDSKATVWNEDTLGVIHNLQGHNSSIKCLKLDKHMLATGSRDGTVRVWNVVTGECICTCAAYSTILALYVDADNRTVISGDSSSFVSKWYDIQSNNKYVPETLAQEKGGWITYVELKNDTLYYATNSGVIGVGEKKYKMYDACVNALRVVPQLNALFAATDNGLYYHVISDDNSMTKTLLGSEGTWVNAITLLPMSSTKSLLLGVDEKGGGFVFDVTSHKRLYNLASHSREVLGVQARFKQHTAATVSWDGTIYVYNFDTDSFVDEDAVSDTKPSQNHPPSTTSTAPKYPNSQIKWKKPQ